jgi:hypothetical protein
MNILYHEECLLPGYKNPNLTSQETYYISATEPSRLMVYKKWGLPSSGMLRFVALVRTDVSKEHRYSIIRVTRIGELEKH